MADLSTTLMGLKLSSPVIVGASTFSRNTDNIKKAEDVGAGALVIHSLFQEQIELERQDLDEALSIGAETFAESLTYFPHMEHAGAREHVMWVEQARKRVEFPLIGSLNASWIGDWVGYAKQLQDAGCDALELNLYSVESDPSEACHYVEERALEIVSTVKALVTIPVSVKLSPFYTSMANFVTRVANAGADAVVLFNRFYQPYIDPEKERLDVRLELSRAEDARLPLRWIALLSDQIKADFEASTGVHTGADVVRELLAGAKAAQCVSTIYIHGMDYIADMNRDIAAWMDARGYGGIDDFRGKLSKKCIEGDPRAFERAQYVRAILNR